jgi:multidrug efflux system membrane fusion protein
VQHITALTSDDQNTAVQGLNAGVNLATSGFDRLENGVQVRSRPGRRGSKHQGRGSGSHRRRPNAAGGANSAVSREAP